MTPNGVKRLERIISVYVAWTKSIVLNDLSFVVAY